MHYRTNYTFQTISNFWHFSREVYCLHPVNFTLSAVHCDDYYFSCWEFYQLQYVSSGDIVRWIVPHTFPTHFRLLVARSFEHCPHTHGQQVCSIIFVSYSTDSGKHQMRTIATWVMGGLFFGSLAIFLFILVCCLVIALVCLCAVAMCMDFLVTCVTCKSNDLTTGKSVAVIALSDYCVT